MSRRSHLGQKASLAVYNDGKGTVMEWQDRIELRPEVLAGKPVVKGTRLAVEFIVDLLAQGWSEAAIVENYPGLTKKTSRRVSPMPARLSVIRRSTP
jgi:uncharacterized protein (DUF433 family)